MPDNIAYIGKDLDEKIPQKIILYASMTLIDDDEKILAVFGSCGGLSGYNFLICTDDFIIYFSNAAIPTKKLSMLYEDIAAVRIYQKGKKQFFEFGLKNGSNIDAGFKTEDTQAEKMLEFINGYMEFGARLNAERIAGNPRYECKAGLIRHGKDLKYGMRIYDINRESEKRQADIEDKYENGIAEREDKHNQRMEDIHRKADASINKNNQSVNVMLNAPLQKFQYELVSGFGSNPFKAELRINALKKLVTIGTGSSLLLEIPFSSVKGCEITTDKEIPELDLSSSYDYFLHFHFIYDGMEKEYVFKYNQRQHGDRHDIHILGYVLNNINAL